MGLDVLEPGHPGPGRHEPELGHEAPLEEGAEPDPLSGVDDPPAHRGAGRHEGDGFGTGRRAPWVGSPWTISCSSTCCCQSASPSRARQQAPAWGRVGAATAAAVSTVPSPIEYPAATNPATPTGPAPGSPIPKARCRAVGDSSSKRRTHAPVSPAAGAERRRRKCPTRSSGCRRSGPRGGRRGRRSCSRAVGAPPRRSEAERPHRRGVHGGRTEKATSRHTSGLRR